jgi:16S rRNA (guanine966-N2)-methyltransferase
MRGRAGKPPAGVRPTTAKVLESLMAILQPCSEGARALDLFAGTGQVGLRLLEQGARQATFVESDAKVAAALRLRLKAEAVPAARYRLLVGRIPRVLQRLEGGFDLILADPPYDWSEQNSLLSATARLATSEAILVVEHHHKTAYAESCGWHLQRQEKYGETRLSFFRFAAEEATC